MSRGPIRIAPSILSADFATLGASIAAVEKGGADLIHVDVMDGHFVPNITIGPPVVKSLKKAAGVPLDVHLMITVPDRFAEAFAEAGAAMPWVLLGVHSARMDMSTRDLEHDESLGLNCAWYADMLMTLTASTAPPNPAAMGPRRGKPQAAGHPWR